MIPIILTIIFGVVWWFAFIFVGSSLTYLMILGSVLAVCVCCCKGGGHPLGWFSFTFQHYVACLLRCLLATLFLIISLFVVGLIVQFITIGFFPPIVVFQILIAAIAAPLLVRLICCAYES